MEQGYDEQREKLKMACEEAFKLYPNSCSHAVTHVIMQYKRGHPYMTANQLLQEISRHSHWREVSAHEVAALASRGILVVGGAAKDPHGHVIVVFPGNETPAGGYKYTNRKGELHLMKPRGCYARAMSTSMGHFPGARSNGDKTIWDPWANDEVFKTVRLWEFIGVPSTSGRQRQETSKFRNPPEEIWIDI